MKYLWGKSVTRNVENLHERNFKAFLKNIILSLKKWNSMFLDKEIYHHIDTNSPKVSLFIFCGANKNTNKNFHKENKIILKSHGKKCRQKPAGYQEQW
jgi:hypothetical protein